MNAREIGNRPAFPTAMLSCKPGMNMRQAYKLALVVSGLNPEEVALNVDLLLAEDARHEQENKREQGCVVT